MNWKPFRHLAMACPLLIPKSTNRVDSASFTPVHSLLCWGRNYMEERKCQGARCRVLLCISKDRETEAVEKNRNPLHMKNRNDSHSTIEYEGVTLPEI